MPPAKHCIDLAICVSLYERLHSFVSSIRTEEAFTAYEDKAELMVELEKTPAVVQNMSEQGTRSGYSMRWIPR